jgi:AcrR family transcriptional regulator
VRVARYGKEHKQATRRRIIETSGRQFKQDGIDGSGVAMLMADAGLTNGAFYAHFASKEDLVATAVADQLRKQRERFNAVAPGWVGVEQIVREYLSVQHRDEDGCPSATLLDQTGVAPMPPGRPTARARHDRRHRRPAGAAGSAVGTRVDAQHLRVDGRDAAAAPCPRRPAAL